MHNVREDDGQVEVCVALISPKGDIYGGQVLVDVFNNGTDIWSIPANHMAASKQTWHHT